MFGNGIRRIFKKIIGPHPSSTDLGKDRMGEGRAYGDAHNRATECQGRACGMISRRDWTLIVLAAAEGSALSPVQLQKALFLIGEDLPWATGNDFYKFVPYNYGPFDSSIYHDADELSSGGLAVVGYQAGRRYCEYAISPQGQKRAEQVMAKIKPEVAAHVKSVVKWVKNVSFEQLLRTIYDKYPQYAVNSVFRK